MNILNSPCTDACLRVSIYMSLMIGDYPAHLAFHLQHGECQAQGLPHFFLEKIPLPTHVCHCL